MPIHSRRGFSLIELLIAMVVAALLGATTLSLMLSQSKFTERMEGQRSGRAVGRSAVNALANDLRMVDPAWGIEAASATSLTVKVPYALGLICSSTTSAGNTVYTILVLPVDSVTLNLPGYSGFALRGSTGVYNPISGGTVAEVSVSATCTGSPANMFSITAPSSAPNQKTRQITITVVGSTLVAVGTPVMLYRRTQFYFGNSGQTGLTTRTALWRNYLSGGSGAVELAAPFDSTAAFRFYDQAATTAQTSVPAALTDIMGFELYLPGQSEKTSRSRSTPEQANVTTSIFLVNRVN